MTLKIRGIGESIIFGNETTKHFRDINYLKEVYINGNKQDKIEYKYNFNQTINFVELFWDDNINNCEYMFSKCSNITEIDLSSFKTSQVIDMDYMFSDCSSLTSLNLSNVDTSKVKFMKGMFYDCSSLTSLDLSIFNTSIVESMDSMFYMCENLQFINNYQNMFHQVPDNVVICINENINHETIFKEIQHNFAMFYIAWKIGNQNKKR